MSDNKSSVCGFVCRLWQVLKKPSVTYSIGALLAVGFVSGIIFWGGFNTAMEMTNNEEFCISCHEMKDNVYEEYKKKLTTKGSNAIINLYNRLLCCVYL